MSDKVKARLIMERWSSSIAQSDRKHDKLSGLFHGLFEDMFYAGIDLETAHAFSKEAAKLLYPSAGIVKKTYAASPARKFSTAEEFAKQWHDQIDKAAAEAFFAFYDLGIEKDPNRKQHSQPGPKSDDELNEEDFWGSVKSVSKDNPWLFKDEK